MPAQFLLPSAVDYIRVINDNTVDNLLAGQPSYTRLPSLYQQAYMLVHETGAIRLSPVFAAPTVTSDEPNITPTVDPARW